MFHWCMRTWSFLKSFSFQILFGKKKIINLFLSLSCSFYFYLRGFVLVWHIVLMTADWYMFFDTRIHIKHGSHKKKGRNCIFFMYKMLCSEYARMQDFASNFQKLGGLFKFKSDLFNTNEVKTLLQDVLCSTLNDNGTYIFFQNGTDKYIFIRFTLFCQSIDDNFIFWTKKRNVRAECDKCKLHVYSKIRKKVLSFITHFLFTISTNFLIIFIDISRYLWIYDSTRNIYKDVRRFHNIERMTDTIHCTWLNDDNMS